jgi:hypothetical protein
MFWAIVLIGIGTTGVTYVGQFEQQEICQTALQVLQKQGYKGACVQMQKKTVEPATKK